jgi:two-component system NtrC family response regulator
MEKRQPLLIIEDDPALQKQMRWAFDAYQPVLANDAESAIARLRQSEPAVVTMDLGLPPHPDDATVGFQLLEEILSLAPETKVIVLTGQNDRANGVRAIGLGAYDFFAKPFEPDLLGHTIERAYRLHELQQEVRRLQEAQTPEAFGGIITRDPEMLRVCRMMEKVAPTDATVMILGESGTGKELFARALHQSSARKVKRFAAINCAAIPETLLESELFGYERGAFTGANKQTIGRIEAAEGGTLFLDEIGDMPPAPQAKLLRFLQERVIERLGGRETIPVDVRVVCATHQNLKDLIKQGRFREDLFYRLSEIVAEVPPLRSRKGDASLLTHAFVRRFAEEQKRGTLVISPEAISAIERHEWPGNVRELENCAKRAVILSDGPMLLPEHFGLEGGVGEANLNLRQVREDAERDAVLRALARTNGNVSRAAELLGVSRPTLYDLLTRFGLRTGGAENAPGTQEVG